MDGKAFRELLNHPQEPGLEYIARPEVYENQILKGWKMDVVKYGNELDRYCPAKLGQLTAVIGHTTVGKTTTLLWMMARLIKAGKKILIYSNENRVMQLHRTLLRFITGHQTLSVEDLHTWREYVRYIEFKRHFTARELLDQATYCFDAGFDFDFFLIDPYNALRIDPTVRVNTHEYHYQCADEMRVFCLNSNKSIFLNCHTVTEAQRVKPDQNGHRPAPLDSDVEGGAKFPNKADDTIVIHRQTSSKLGNEKYITEIHVRKIRNKEFGGDTTPWDIPMRINFRHDWTGFDFVSGPVQKTEYKQQTFYEPSF